MFKSLTGVPDSFDAVLRVNNTPAKKVDYKKLFKNAGDLKAEMLDSFHNGMKHGLTTYSAEIDKIFTWMPGFLVCITGWPQMGKSEFILFLCMLRAKNAGSKFLIYSPESGKPFQYLNTLIHCYLGQNIDLYYSNRVSEKEYLRGLEFVNEYFTIIDRKEFTKQGLLPTPDLLRSATEFKHAQDTLFAVIKDPWNQLHHDFKERDDLYLANQLPQEKELAENLDIINIILAHPKGFTDNYNAKEGLPIPTWRNIAGGPMWNNMCDLIGAVHRPFYYKDNTDRCAVFATQKIKQQRYVAYPGVQELVFHPDKNRYFINGNDVLSDIGVQKEYSYYEINNLPNSTEFEQENPPF